MTVCVSDPAEKGFQCFNQQNQKTFFLKYEDSDHYIALSPSDAQVLFNYCAGDREEEDIDIETVQKFKANWMAQKEK